MRILLKCPTRGRREKFLSTIQKWVGFADDASLLGILVSADTDDITMRGFTEADLPDVSWKKVCFGANKTKIEACNADMDIEWQWDIVILVSDDMIPEVKGYDTRIRKAMKSLDHVVWVYDGFQNENLNTLNIFGRLRYKSWGYLYHPSYKSLFCDNEVTDWCKDNPGKCTIIPHVLVKHDHPLATSSVFDEIYARNQIYYNADSLNYKKRRMSTIASRFGFLKLLSRR